MRAERTVLSEAYDRNEAMLENDQEGADADTNTNAYEAEEQGLSCALDALDDRLDAARATLRMWSAGRPLRLPATAADSGGTQPVRVARRSSGWGTADGGRDVCRPVGAGFGDFCLDAFAH